MNWSTCFVRLASVPGPVRVEDEAEREEVEFNDDDNENAGGEEEHNDERGEEE